MNECDICPPKGVGKRALVMKKVEGSWVENEVRLHDADDIKNFCGKGMKVTQVNLDRYRKIYYSVDSLAKMESPQIECNCINSEGNREFMVSPIMLVECDDTQPIDLSENVEKSIKAAIDFH